MQINLSEKQGHWNEFRSGSARTGVWGCDPQQGSKGQSPWWGQGAKPPGSQRFLKI